MEETKYISTTETAKLIRGVLKDNFPQIKFSVRSKSYSGGSSISIDYVNGVSVKKVEDLVKRFQGASFDGMIDLKSYHDTEYNGEKVHFGSDYVFVNRTLTEDIQEKIARWIAERYGVEFKDLASCPNITQNYDNWYNIVWKYSYDKDENDFCKEVEVNF